MRRTTSRRLVAFDLGEPWPEREHFALIFPSSDEPAPERLDSCDVFLSLIWKILQKDVRVHLGVLNCRLLAVRVESPLKLG